MILNFKLVLFYFCLGTACNFLIIYLQKFFVSKKNNQIQDIHQGNISRLGGLVIFILFFIYASYSHFISIEIIFFMGISLFLGFLEDIGLTINPIIRLIFIFLSCFFVVSSFNLLPSFDFLILNSFFNSQIFKYIFFTLAMATVVNGQNIIDGTNGLSAFTSVTIFTCLLFLGLVYEDIRIVQISLVIISLLIAFLVFNYPFGKVFLGDGGSYFCGFLASYLVIDIFARNPIIPTWSAVSILFYPTLEVIFSYFRKIFQKKSPFKPDDGHLHLKLYLLISKNNRSSRLYNALVAPFLSIVWLSPLALLPLSLELPHFAMLITLFLILIYCFFYYAIPKFEK